jgi:D-lactate dehydrogenase
VLPPSRWGIKVKAAVDSRRNGLVVVVDKYDGSLKAEHGTGRNIAPFVGHELGPKLTSLMWKLKRLADPDNILSPGVMLTKDHKEQIRNLHTVPTVESEVDRCIECGYCEPVCPSRNLTTSPRQRIVLRREMLRQPSGSPLTAALLKEYEYEAIETCAGEGCCALACPVGINTGLLMKQFRQAEHNQTQEYVAKKIAEKLGYSRSRSANGFEAKSHGDECLRRRAYVTKVRSWPRVRWLAPI